MTELRKAQADGEVLEERYYNASVECWGDLRHTIFSKAPCWYRIKSDEPTFKVGDWARTKDEVFKIDRIDNHIYPICGNYSRFSAESVELWEPTEGETVIVRDNKSQKWMIDSNYKKDTWKYVKPLEFIQTLKD